MPKLDSEVFFVVNLDTDKETNMKYQAALEQRPLWSALKAVRLDQVYLVDRATWHGYSIFAAYAVLDDIEKYLVNDS
ncbi:hypothetical protein [Leptolyngbya sp. 7M]|uniref:hypothetical protein n=1 Tax=Leptolyngbya sp. 7M TaxID=2812896 RepID=UPI001B8D7557|nr:hypothetical protein [Leptolyngbya sp. 7M]QYO68271.1 hypothetical protein JVX88_16790 [Leptolyngbya sp. 7M]